MLLTSVNDIDSRFEGSKTSGGTINLEKYRGKMGTGLTDAYQLLMQIEGTPCLKVNWSLSPLRNISEVRPRI